MREIAEVALGTCFLAVVFGVEHWLLPAIILVLAAVTIFSTPFLPVSLFH